MSGPVSPAPMFLFLFLLLQFKLPLFLCLSLFTANNLTFSFQLFLLQFQSLLRFCTYSSVLYLFPHFSLYPFRITPSLLYISFHSRTKSQPIVILQDKIIYLIVFRFRTKRNLAYRELSLRYTFKNAYPEWLLKKILLICLLLCP